MKPILTLTLSDLLLWLSDEQYNGASVRAGEWRSTWIDYNRHQLPDLASRQEFWSKRLELNLDTIAVSRDVSRVRVSCERNKAGKKLAGAGDRNLTGHEERTFWVSLSKNLPTTLLTTGNDMNREELRALIRECVQQEMHSPAAPQPSRAVPATAQQAQASTGSVSLDATSANRLIETMFQAIQNSNAQERLLLFRLLAHHMRLNETMQSQNLQLVASQFNVEEPWLDKFSTALVDNKDNLSAALSALVQDPSSPEFLRQMAQYGNIGLAALPTGDDDDDDDDFDEFESHPH